MKTASYCLLWRLQCVNGSMDFMMWFALREVMSWRFVVGVGCMLDKAETRPCSTLAWSVTLAFMHWPLSDMNSLEALEVEDWH